LLNISQAKEDDMQKYKDYQPTGFDRKGAFLHEQGEWLVVPVIQTRDSRSLERSNFKTALEMLGGEDDTVEVHRFGHWGPGWYEIIIVSPYDKDKVKVAEEIERSLEDYPILDEDDFLELELEEANEVWCNCYNLQERIELCAENNISIFAARHDYIPQDDDGHIFERMVRS
jgi:hypothetical protein